MYATETIAGYECNIILSRDGAIIRAITVLVGDENRPGWRRKDAARGFGDVRDRRRAARDAVIAALASDSRAAWLRDNRRAGRRGLITVAARYSELTEVGGVLVRRDAEGRPIACYQA